MYLIPDSPFDLGACILETDNLQPWSLIPDISEFGQRQHEIPEF